MTSPNGAGYNEHPGQSKYEALHELRATIEEQNERAEKAVHEAISKASEVSTGVPEVDAALARFNLALGQMVARAGDESDELVDALAKEAEKHKPTEAACGPDAPSDAEGSRTGTAPTDDASSADDGET